jgi:hypothetical protein
VSDQDKKRYDMAAEDARRHGEDQVIGRYGGDPAGVWALKSLAITVAVAGLGFVMGGWSTAVIFSVVWAVSAVVLRVYAMRLKNRRQPR